MSPSLSNFLSWCFTFLIDKMGLTDISSKCMAGQRIKLDYEQRELGTDSKCWALLVIIRLPVLNLKICFSAFQFYGCGEGEIDSH